MNPFEGLVVKISPHEIGEHTYISEFSHVSQWTQIGKFCSIANLVTIGAQQHNMESLTTFPFEEVMDAMPRRVTIIGNDVWIGSGAVIMAGVKVGSGAVIGAGAIVTKDVPPYAIVLGNPARVIRYRFPPPLVKELLETRWWDLPADVIRELPIRDPKACIEKIRKLVPTNI